MKNLPCSLVVSHIFRMSLTNVVNEVRVWVSCVRSLLEIICNVLSNKTVEVFSSRFFILYCVGLDSDGFVTVFEAPQCTLELAQLLQAICIKL